MVDCHFYAETAAKSGLIGTPYETMDCQAFVEKTLALVDVKHNWKGSNDQWRNALSWKGTIDECLEKFGCIPDGAWLFTIKHDGKEPSYYTDGVNASHVGLYVGSYGEEPVMHSTTGGVQWGKWPDSKRWTHVGLEKDISYNMDDEVESAEAFNKAIEIVDKLKGLTTYLENLIFDDCKKLLDELENMGHG